MSRLRLPPLPLPRPRTFTGLLALLSLLAVLLGWQPNQEGHSRPPSASASLPVLPDLRPAPTPQPGVPLLPGPPGSVAHLPGSGWPDLTLPVHRTAVARRPDLLTLGRLNTDGG
ncbi:hypothetical protein [Deinococcus sonorensis]|uniref:Uncharacterized protein n=2 Tax=Deinococcus sonorensis TaxID=309891 RepID=A0AAU7U8P2_9DEIO